MQTGNGMRGKLETGPARGQPRLVQRPDGFADYVEDVHPPQKQKPKKPKKTKTAKTSRKRQRPIRSTFTMLLVVPLLSLTALWGYSFATTIGGFLASRADTQVSDDIGEPLQGVLAQLNAEATLTYAQPANPTLLQQRPRTDAAIAAFRAGQSRLRAAGGVPAQARSAAADLLARLRTLPALRAEADGHAQDPLTVLEGYGTVTNSVFAYIAALPDPRSPAPVFSRSMGELFMGQALTDIATEAALGDGATRNHGVLTAPAYRLFARTVAAQRQLDDSGDTMMSFRNESDGDAYLTASGSPKFRDFQAIEDKIIDAGPGQPLPVTADTWTRMTKEIIGPLTAEEARETVKVARDNAHRADVAEYQVLGVGGAGLLAVLLSALMLARSGRRVGRELRDLRAAARRLAFQQLPDLVTRLRAGEDLDAEAEAPPLRLKTKTLEVTQTAEAFSAVQRTATQTAIEQAALRKAVNNVYRSLARRNQGLLQRQLRMLDEMERGTEDPDALEQLFRLDHLTTRMRRQAEGLIILSGATPGRGWRRPVQVVEVLRGAIGEIEEYARVDLSTDSQDYLQGTGVADVTHLLAELVENAVSFSPPGTRVQVRGSRVANGYAVEIEDRGLGIGAETRRLLNQRLADPPDFDVADTDQLGLFVVSRLAARHGVKVSLRGSSYGGITAIVLLPPSLVVAAEEAAYLAVKERVGLTGPIVIRGMKEP